MIFLTILKWIGIVLLAFVALIVLFFMLFLFFPFVYRFSAEKKEAFKAKVSLSFLFRFLYVSIKYENNEPLLVARVIGIPVYKTNFDFLIDALKDSQNNSGETKDSTDIDGVLDNDENTDEIDVTDNATEERLEELLKKPLKVELRDVSYTYPGQAKPTLSHINLTIESGEKLALLGLNGAGKTTMVKLICGFYRPTEGEIYFNGIPAGSLTREENYKLVTVLFQDSTMLPSTLDDNLTGTDRKEERLSQVLAISGFTEKYHSLIRKGKKAQLVKEVNENAVEFSGGEKQKFLFARALYKDASLMILDEPTAALDPIAENEMYLKYKEATKGRTSIYISHRLSSTRFCDRIILLEHGRIVEEGTHESLLKEDGRYAYLYQIQGQYYRNQEEQMRLSKIMGDTYIEEEAGKEGVFHE